MGNIDGHGNANASGTLGAGGILGGGVSGVLGYSYTSADTVADLNGWGASVGVSIATIPIGPLDLVLGGEFNVGGSYWGLSFYVGLGKSTNPLRASPYAEGTYTGELYRLRDSNRCTE